MAYEDMGNPEVPLLDKLNDAIAAGFMTTAQRDDLIAQIDYYNANQATIESAYPDMWVAIANSMVFAAASRPDAEYLAMAAFPGRPCWVVPVPNRKTVLNFQDS